MKTNKLYPTWFTLGALIFYLGLFFLPGIMGIGYSFTDWNAYSSEVNFVGWKNYLKVFEGGTNYGMFQKYLCIYCDKLHHQDHARNRSGHPAHQQDGKDEKHAPDAGVSSSGHVLSDHRPGV